MLALFRLWYSIAVYKGSFKGLIITTAAHRLYIHSETKTEEISKLD